MLNEPAATSQNCLNGIQGLSGEYKHDSWGLLELWTGIEALAIRKPPQSFGLFEKIHKNLGSFGLATGFT